MRTETLTFKPTGVSVNVLTSSPLISVLQAAPWLARSPWSMNVEPRVWGLCLCCSGNKSHLAPAQASVLPESFVQTAEHGVMEPGAMVRFACSEVSVHQKDRIPPPWPRWRQSVWEDFHACWKTSTRALRKDRKDNATRGSMNDGACSFGSSAFQSH